VKAAIQVHLRLNISITDKLQQWGRYRLPQKVLLFFKAFNLSILYYGDDIAIVIQLHYDTKIIIKLHQYSCTP